MELRQLTLRRATLVACAATLICAALPVSASAATSGALDPTFGSGGYATAAYGTWAAAAADVVQRDGYVVTAGQTNVNGIDEIIVTRFTDTGQPDPGFGSGGIVTVDIGGSAGVDSGAALALQPDGKIVLAGVGFGGGRDNFAVVRLNPDGSRDSTFAQNGVATIPVGDGAYATAVLIDGIGRIDVAGTTQVAGVNHFAVSRLTPAGALDTSFGTGGTTVLAPYAAAWGMVLQSDGSLVIGGQELSNSTQMVMAARVTDSGALDPSFGNGGVVTVPVSAWAVGYAINLQSDGKIVLGANAKAADGSPLGAVIRLNPDGSLDSSFASGGILQFPGGGINLMTIDGFGHIYLVGVGATVIRLNPNGSTDTTFGQGGFVAYCDGINCAANGSFIDPRTGNLVLAGIATINGRPQVMALRLLTPPTTSPVTTNTSAPTASAPTPTVTLPATTTVLQAPKSTPKLAVGTSIRRPIRLPVKARHTTRKRRAPKARATHRARHRRTVRRHTSRRHH